jgi:putative cardiolipin synthase
LGWFGQVLEFLFAGYRLNHRMHNKAWIVDDQLFIGGGRNIGDEYFDASRQFNFRDLDLAIGGAVAQGARALFDAYWTSSCVRPIERVALSKPLAGGLDELRRQLDGAIDAAPSAGTYLDRLRTLSGLPSLLEEGRTLLSADKVHIMADAPGKGLRRHHDPGLLLAIRAAVEGARHDVLLISPYFVPGRRGLRWLVRLARRGVRVRVLTNSLAATDVLAAHGGYARYRRRLLKAGIELHELKRGGQEGHTLFGSGGASLHTKAIGVDGVSIFVGSFNLDPRSARLNTEMGAFVTHPAPAAQLRAEYERLADPTRSWKVELENGRLAWRDRIAGRPRAVHAEPDATLGRRILARVLGWMPIEPQL